jgi:SAM-dependent methyltransferase
VTDFGTASRDYARFRRGFPPSFFAHLKAIGVGGRVLDLGTGTGAVARELGAIGLDRSVAMLREASGLPRVAACAERAPFRDGVFDVVTAGQCWIWFDGPAAAREAFRMLRPGGRIVVAHFDYLPVGGNMAEQTERLILRYNPAWPLAGREPRDRRDQAACEHLRVAGFEKLDFWCREEPVEYTREAWRGRFRACNGVIDIGDAGKVAAFDAELAELLTRHPEPVVSPHRVSALVGRRPSGG